MLLSENIDLSKYNIDGKKLVYIASPYAHDDMLVVNERVKSVTDVTCDIILKLSDIVVPFSPIAYTHGLDQTIKQRNSELGSDKPIEIDWYTFDLVYLLRCDALLVLELKGWQQSMGVALEIAFAKKHEIPIIYSLQEHVIQQLIGKFYPRGRKLY